MQSNLIDQLQKEILPALLMNFHNVLTMHIQLNEVRNVHLSHFRLPTKQYFMNIQWQTFLREVNEEKKISESDKKLRKTLLKTTRKKKSKIWFSDFLKIWFEILRFFVINSFEFNVWSSKSETSYYTVKTTEIVT